MKIGIDPENRSYADAWIKYCEDKTIAFELISLYDSKLFQKLDGVTHYLAAPTLSDLKTCTYAKSIFRCLEHRQIKVFPNQASFWHYDDKIAQMYLLESIGAPLVASRVFFQKEDAFEWLRGEAKFPFVFKLKAGAGSSNVKLFRSDREARKQVKRMFGKGEIAVPSYFGDFATKVRKTKASGSFGQKISRAPTTVMRLLERRFNTPRERGYFYVQEFLPGNNCDTRITVIGDRAYGFRRFVRPNDFRASGGGNINWQQSEIDIRCIEIAHETSKRLRFDCMAYDFINGLDGKPKIVEMSYNFVPSMVNRCEGYWDKDLNFSAEKEANVQILQLQNLIG